MVVCVIHYKDFLFNAINVTEILQARHCSVAPSSQIKIPVVRDMPMPASGGLPLSIKHIRKTLLASTLNLKLCLPILCFFLFVFLVCSMLKEVPVTLMRQRFGL